MAARIVHGRRLRRRHTPTGGTRGGNGAGAPPAVPPPLPPTQEFVDDDNGGGDDSGGEDSGLRQGRRRAKDLPAAVVAVDLLDMEPLPGVEVRGVGVCVGGGGGAGGKEGQVGCSSSGDTLVIYVWIDTGE